MKNICIIGAGNIGSRHLQGIKKIRLPLNIEVVDPSTQALSTAQQRYEQIPTSAKHKISFFQDITDISENIDLAIIATNSNIRRQITEKILSKSSVKYLILEKILFQKREDYFIINDLLVKKGCKTWINFSMRTMPFYSGFKGKTKGKIHMVVSGSQYGLVTNAIHYIDYLAFLTDCYDYTIEAKPLDKRIVKSKRPGFMELNGSLVVLFKNGSIGTFTCYPKGDIPYMIEVLSEDYRCISKESERKAYISSPSNEWNWEEINTDIPFQSDMTNIVVENILNKGTCPLTAYKDAVKLHLPFLDGLQEFLNTFSDKKYDFYPFT